MIISGMLIAHLVRVDARLVAAVRDPPVQVRAQRREVDLRLFLLV